MFIFCTTVLYLLNVTSNHYPLTLSQAVLERCVGAHSSYKNHSIARFVYQSNDSNRLHKNPIIRVICLNVLRNTMKPFRSINNTIKCMLALVLLTFTLFANAAVQMFLKFEGIDGESNDRDFRNSIDVIAFSEGASNSGSSHLGGGSAGVPTFQNISIVKWLDASSPTLRLKMAQGALIPSATLSVRARTGDAPVVFYEVVLKNVRITNFSAGGSDGEERLSEQVTLGYTEIKWTYTKISEDGSAGAEFTEGWNIQTNSKL
jgi:type VI secretion system secreted protein Hcp